MRTALLAVACLVFEMTLSARPIPANVMITNAVVRTMDSRQPQAEAVAVLGNRIVALGSNKDLAELASPGTRVIDARNRLVLPGFNDAHVHFLSGGFQLSQVDLRDAATPDEFTRRIHEFASSVKPGRWITGGNWDHERWPGTPLPTREMIDAATTNVPVFVSRLDGHMALEHFQQLRSRRKRRNIDIF